MTNNKKDRPAIWSINADGGGQTKHLQADAEIYAAQSTTEGNAIYYFRRVNQTVSLLKAALRSDLASAETFSHATHQRARKRMNPSACRGMQPGSPTREPVLSKSLAGGR